MTVVLFASAVTCLILMVALIVTDFVLALRGPRPLRHGGPLSIVGLLLGVAALVLSALTAIGAP